MKKVTLFSLLVFCFAVSVFADGLTEKQTQNANVTITTPAASMDPVITTHVPVAIKPMVSSTVVTPGIIYVVATQCIGESVTPIQCSTYAGALNMANDYCTTHPQCHWTIYASVLAPLLYPPGSWVVVSWVPLQSGTCMIVE